LDAYVRIYVADVAQQNESVSSTFAETRIRYLAVGSNLLGFIGDDMESRIFDVTTIRAEKGSRKTLLDGRGIHAHR